MSFAMRPRYEIEINDFQTGHQTPVRRTTITQSIIISDRRAPSGRVPKHRYRFIGEIYLSQKPLPHRNTEYRFRSIDQK
jgi:hypothetical protein